jgi:hypothetical protein
MVGDLNSSSLHAACPIQLCVPLLFISFFIFLLFLGSLNSEQAHAACPLLCACLFFLFPFLPLLSCPQTLNAVILSAPYRCVSSPIYLFFLYIAVRASLPHLRCTELKLVMAQTKKAPSCSSRISRRGASACAAELKLLN